MHPRLLEALLRRGVSILLAMPLLASPYEGRWALVPERSDSIEKAIEATVRGMSFIARPIARSRLKRRNVAFPSFTITDERGGGLHVRHQGGMNVTYPQTGQKVRAKAPDGSDVTTWMVPGPVLRLVYEAEGGTREDSYEVAGDGLVLSVRVTSPQLRRPLTYRLRYRKAP